MRKGKKLKSKKKKIFQTKKPKSLTIQKAWFKKPFKYSFYPYLFIISSFRRNIFFNVTNYKGQTKCWTSSGRFGFKGKTKMAHMAIISVTEKFIKKLWSYGIHHVLLIFKNYKPQHRAILRGIKQSLQKKNALKFLSLTIKTTLVFNGCRRKKERRR